MRYYFAPMEGLTDSIYRNLHHRYFPGVDRYYTPFFSPTSHRSLTPREERGLPPADSVPFATVPQVLTRSPEDFSWFARVCRDRGYGEINLNLGCPSGTVVSKGKGSGLLRDPEALDRFLGDIFREPCLPISVKTRLGLARREEFPALLEIFNRYPIRELIVHPRVRSQFYKGAVDREMFAWAREHSQNPLCFNGDLRSLSQVEALSRQFPELEAVMIGRGFLMDPGMCSGGTDTARLESFMGELLDAYTAAFSSERNAMFRLKENWSYLRFRFAGSDKLWKRLRKTTDIREFRAITGEIFHTLPLGRVEEASL